MSWLFVPHVPINFADKITKQTWAEGPRVFMGIPPFELVRTFEAFYSKKNELSSNDDP